HVCPAATHAAFVYLNLRAEPRILLVDLPRVHTIGSLDLAATRVVLGVLRLVVDRIHDRFVGVVAVVLCWTEDCCTVDDFPVHVDPPVASPNPVAEDADCLRRHSPVLPCSCPRFHPTL